MVHLRDEQEDATRPQNTLYLGRDAVDILDVVEGIELADHIERLIGERHRFGVPVHVVHRVRVDGQLGDVAIG